MGLRELSDDVSRISAWWWVGGGAVAAVAGGVWYYRSYLVVSPPDVQALIVLAALTLFVVLLAFATLLSHVYFGKPKQNPFRSTARSAARQTQHSDSVEARQIQERLAVIFRAYGGAAYSGAINLLSMIDGTLERSGGEAHSAVAALILEARKLRQARVQLLRDALDQRGAQPIEALQAQFSQFYDDYQWCSRWIHFAGRLVDYPFATIVAYRKWREADAEFLRALREAISYNGTDALAKAVNEIGWGETIRDSVTLPVVLSDNEKPRLLPVRVYAELRSLIAVGANRPHVGVFCANVNFRNDPIISSPSAEVMNALAEISFRHEGREVLRVMNGRWGDTEQPAVRKAKDPFASLIDLNTVPFRIGETHELNIAVKHPEQAWFYAFDNSTFDFQNWENPSYKLTEHEYRVTVRLRGGHLDDEQHFIVRNLGVGKGLEIEVAHP